MESKGNKILGW